MTFIDYLNYISIKTKMKYYSHPTINKYIINKMDIIKKNLPYVAIGAIGTGLVLYLLLRSSGRKE